LPATLETFRADLEKLIRKFEADQQFYVSKGYLEAQLRVDFINPLFNALGWDVENEAGLAHHQREVLVDRMLELNKRKHSGKLAPSELDRLEREIATTDAQIDELVYELYGITDEERKIIES